jgi:hypothetical protein
MQSTILLVCSSRQAGKFPIWDPLYRSHIVDHLCSQMFILLPPQFIFDTIKLQMLKLKGIHWKPSTFTSINLWSSL